MTYATSKQGCKGDFTDISQVEQNRHRMHIPKHTPISSKALLSTQCGRHEVKMTPREGLLLLGHPTSCHSCLAKARVKLLLLTFFF